MDMLHYFIDALPGAASHPFALVAYLATLGSWLVVAIRVVRNKNLLEKLDAVPPEDRAALLRAEMGEAIPPNLESEQWLRVKQSRYVFLGVMTIIVSITLVIAIAITQAWWAKREMEAMVLGDIYSIEDETIGQLVKLGIVTPHYVESPEYYVDWLFESTNTESKLEMRARSPYYDALRYGGHFGSFARVPPAYPQLSIYLANNSNDVQFATGIRIHVTESRIDGTPIPEIDGGVLAVHAINLGYGPMADAVVDFRVQPSFLRDLNVTDLSVLSNWYSVELGVIEDSKSAMFDERLASELKKLDDEHRFWHVPVEARLSYKLKNGRTVSGKSTVKVETDHPGPEGPSRPTAYYPIILRADISDYVIESRISHSLTPGEADHLALQILSDKSAQYDLSIEVLDSRGSVIGRQLCIIDVISPRGLNLIDGAWVASSTRSHEIDTVVEFNEAIATENFATAKTVFSAQSELANDDSLISSLLRHPVIRQQNTYWLSDDRYELTAYLSATDRTHWIRYTFDEEGNILDIDLSSG